MCLSRKSHVLAHDGSRLHQIKMLRHLFQMRCKPQYRPPNVLGKRVG